MDSLIQNSICWRRRVPLHPPAIHRHRDYYTANCGHRYDEYSGYDPHEDKLSNVRPPSDPQKWTG